MEVNYGPYVADNNVMLSSLALHTWSQGGAYAHNLIAGNVQNSQTWRPDDGNVAPQNTCRTMNNVNACAGVGFWQRPPSF